MPVEMSDLEKVINVFEHISTCAAGNAAAYRRFIREQLIVLRRIAKEVEEEKRRKKV